MTGKLEASASLTKICTSTSTEIGKNKSTQVSVCCDVQLALQGMNEVLENRREVLDFGNLRGELNEQRQKFPLRFKMFGKEILSQYAINLFDELTGGKAIITTGVRSHQMWAAQFYKFKKPRQWLSSESLRVMRFRLSAAIEASISDPEAVVMDIDDDGSFIMNVQELATIRAENLPVKVLLINIEMKLPSPSMLYYCFRIGNRGLYGSRKFESHCSNTS